MALTGDWLRWLHTSVEKAEGRPEGALILRRATEGTEVQESVSKEHRHLGSLGVLQLGSYWFPNNYSGDMPRVLGIFSTVGRSEAMGIRHQIWGGQSPLGFLL